MDCQVQGGGFGGGGGGGGDVGRLVGEGELVVGAGWWCWLDEGRGFG